MVKEIYLTKDRVALVDDEDYDNLIKYRWAFKTCRHKHGTGYGYRTVDISSVGGIRRKTSVYLHRAIMNPPDGYVVDHIDGDGLNNQKKQSSHCYCMGKYAEQKI